MKALASGYYQPTMLNCEFFNPLKVLKPKVTKSLRKSTCAGLGGKDKSRSHSIVIALATIALTTTTDVDFGQNHLREAQREFTQRSTDREREETSKEVLKEKSS